MIMTMALTEHIKSDDDNDDDEDDIDNDNDDDDDDDHCRYLKQLVLPTWNTDDEKQASDRW